MLRHLQNDTSYNFYYISVLTSYKNGYKRILNNINLLNWSLGFFPRLKPKRFFFFFFFFLISSLHSHYGISDWRGQPHQLFCFCFFVVLVFFLRHHLQWHSVAIEIHWGGDCRTILFFLIYKINQKQSYS